ncbi:MAG TPA: pyruvate kinase [Anaerolineales bacterium]|nr:pyruvate kinase [Anaerolineales bacterium]
MPISAIVTVPPYADFLADIASHPIVSGFRLNTVMPLRESQREVLERLCRIFSARDGVPAAEDGGLSNVPVWVDLKGRQLRVVGAAIPPYTEVKLSHRIKVETPVDAYFSDGNERVKVAAVDGDRLILADGPRRLIGPGESVNIIHPSLKIEGTLTNTDKTYLAAMKELGMTKVMLSYVESPEDVDEVKTLLPNAEVILKIETQRGLDFAKKHGSKHGHLMAARGDLYVEVLRPHKVAGAVKTIINADKNAIVASRILDSLAYQPVPVSADIGDVAFLLEIGYRAFMLGDQVCLRRDTVLEALNLLEEMGKDKF